jgi:glycosyltransferase involved in cell wall biosynthesis
MKIAQVAPLSESVPPRLYGGTERVVSYLTEELVRQGHDVTLFASGDSVTAAKLVPCSRAALRLDQAVRDVMPYHVIMLEKVRRRIEEFDVVHFHTDYLHFPLLRASGGIAVTTLHGRLDLPDLEPLYREFSDMPVISISHHQRAPLSRARWVGNVYHGLPLDLYAFNPYSTRDYLVFLGRICPEKRPDRAVEIAQRLNMPLRIAAKVDMVDERYFVERIKALLRLPGIEYLGEVGERDKTLLLGNAAALLFPIDWPEPFGLTMVEAMACGTPVVAWRSGSVPEIVEEGVTGFIVDNVDEAVAAVRRARTLDRKLIRRRFEERFSVKRMAAEYFAIYESLGTRPSLFSPEPSNEPQAA